MDDEVEDVSSWELDDEEWLGDQEKFWLSEPGGSAQHTGQRWLFKPSRRVPLKGRRGAPSREFTWFDAQSELIAYNLAQLLGVPSASIRLARWNDECGCISRDVRRENEDLHSGDTYLAGLGLPEYVPNAERSRNRTGHNIHAIERVLAGVPGPARDSSHGALEVFAGYLTLDAWIGNSDRHAENWALTVGGGTTRLAASFDHGSSLAAGVGDPQLATMDVRAYASKGMARKFDQRRVESLVDLAHRALDRWGGPWLETLRRVEDRDVQEIVVRVPGLSGLRRTFITRLLEENRRRLLER